VYNEKCINLIKTKRKESMSKKIIAGALSVATVVSSCAVLGGMTFAATDAWHQVTVTPGQELILGGSTSSTVPLSPSITSIDSGAPTALTVKATQPWKIEWQAVTGDLAAVSTTGALGVRLGTSGFTDSGGYAYAGSQTTATAGADQWGAVLAASGGTLATTPTLTTSLSTAMTGTATSSATLTPTYSAGTSGALGMTSYYGTIYYVLSANP